MNKKSYDFSKVSIKTLATKVNKADKRINEAMYEIGLIGIEVERRGDMKLVDFAKLADVSKFMLSKAMKAVRFFDENGGKSLDNFEYSKLALVASSPSNFTAITDKLGVDGIAKLSKSVIEDVAASRQKIKAVTKDGKVIVEAMKSKDKTDNKADDKAKAKADDINVTVTDENGVKYSIPMSVLAKYKVEE